MKRRLDALYSPLTNVSSPFPLAKPWVLKPILSDITQGLSKGNTCICN